MATDFHFEINTRLAVIEEKIDALGMTRDDHEDRLRMLEGFKAGHNGQTKQSKWDARTMIQLIMVGISMIAILITLLRGHP